MKIKFIPTLISAALALLVGYGFFAANGQEWQKWLMFAVTAVEFIVLLVGGFGIKYAERGGANITVLSVVFIIVALVANLIFTFAPFATAPFIIISGILILLYVGIAYALAKALAEV